MVVASRQMSSSSVRFSFSSGVSEAIAIMQAAGPQVNSVVCRYQGTSRCSRCSGSLRMRFCMRSAV